MATFRDRSDAGTRLGDALVDRGVTADVVLAIPRGGLPLGRAVADALDAPLDVVAAKKLGAPHNPELAIGAVASDGSTWLNDELIAELGVSDAEVAEERDRVAALVREKEERYRGDRIGEEFEGQRVVIVDDGVATGATAIACLRRLRAAGADRVVLAVPVGSPDTVERLEREADEVVALETPAVFRAVGQFYDRFEQVQDEEAMTYLEG